MRVCGRFPKRARQLYWGWSTFAPRPDGGVLALSFVTALIARPWKVGVRVRITCGNVPGAPPYSWQKLAECELDCSGTIDARFCAWRTPGGVKSVNLCELSVPGTEARCHRDEGGTRANHGSARCSRAGATAGGRTEMRGQIGHAKSQPFCYSCRRTRQSD